MGRRRRSKLRWAPVAGFFTAVLWLFVIALSPSRGPGKTRLLGVPPLGFLVLAASTILGVLSLCHLFTAPREKGWVLWMARGAWIIPLLNWLLMLALLSTGQFHFPF